MARAKKAKHGNRVVTYVRLLPEDHAQLAQIAKDRGWPHTIASVARELIAQCLKTSRAKEPASPAHERSNQE